MGVCQTDAESADISFTSGHKFSSRPLRILSEYGLMTFFYDVTDSECNSQTLGKLGKWISPGDLQGAIDSRFPGCMKGRTMYVIPFSMGPIGGPISKNGVQLTDSAYVVVSMNIMTRMDKQVFIGYIQNFSLF